ncbi:dihydrofolate reductase family protein [Blastococcus tunisiensis]|uniref:Dihydrofolate reductase n=1 Tax=Blastococcus tunisiensis TaxID=1798228 RepID=A0A1I2IVS5_9ACTN|nr:dihydrofolate reductase family protein [Blastococcus sp. DSM 46838]SFF46592.1 Dihydrofolate reductase [Blastococcus sp. DSM 46838]
MTHVIGGMTVSLDGFFEDADGGISALYSDLEGLQDSACLDAARAETGAALMGRRFFDMAPDPDGYADGYEFQVPIVVVTHRAPEREPKRNDRLFFTFVTDGVEAAVARAAELAGDRAVTVLGGADLTRGLLAAGLVDELRVDVMPVLLGGGRRLLDGIPPGTVQLEKLGVEEHGARTTLRFRVLRQGPGGRR